MCRAAIFHIYSFLPLFLSHPPPHFRRFQFYERFFSSISESWHCSRIRRLLSTLFFLISKLFVQTFLSSLRLILTFSSWDIILDYSTTRLQFYHLVPSFTTFEQPVTLSSSLLADFSDDFFKFPLEPCHHVVSHDTKRLRQQLWIGGCPPSATRAVSICCCCQSSIS